MKLVQEDLIDGSEQVKFIRDSLPFTEKYGLSFKQNGKREIKTISTYLNQLSEFFTELFVLRTSWNSFKILVIDEKQDKREIMSCELADDRYVSDNYKENEYEEHHRIYKVKDISQLIEYLLATCEKLHEINTNFSIKDWMIEQKLVPHEILLRRILQVIHYCRYNHITDINDDEDAKLYITDYLQLILRKTIQNPNDFNYIIGLRLNKYILPEDYLGFNVIFKIIIGLLKRGDKITYDRIKQLDFEYKHLEKSILQYINRRLS